MISELFRVAFRNVGKRRKRAALTMLGVFIGIAAVVALVSLGQGLQKTINDQFEKIGADKIYIQAKDPAMIGEDVPNAITSHEKELISKVNGVMQTSAIVFRGASVKYNNIQRTQFLMSAPDDRKEVELAYAFTTWEIEEGRKVTHKDKGKAAIGYNLGNRKLFERNIHVGDKIEVEGKKIEVVGIFKRTGDPGMDAGILISEEEVRELLELGDTYNYIIAQTVAGEDPEFVAEKIKKTLRRDRHLDEGKEDFTVQSSTDLIASFNAIFNVIQVVFVGIAAISLLVGGIGIMNSMYTSVLERTREIGVMKAIGARNSDVLTLFLIESGFLGLAGGGIGVLIGIGISKLVEFGTNTAFGPGTIVAYFPWYLIVGALAFSLVVGALSGALPARRASKLKPVEALRYE